MEHSFGSFVHEFSKFFMGVLKIGMKRNTKDFLKNRKPDVAIPDKSVKVLANSIYQSLREEGCKTKDIIGISSQLLGLVTSSLQHNESVGREEK